MNALHSLHARNGGHVIHRMHARNGVNSGILLMLGHGQGHVLHDGGDVHREGSGGLWLGAESSSVEGHRTLATCHVVVRSYGWGVGMFAIGSAIGARGFCKC